MVKGQELVWFQREFCVGLPLVVGKLHFVRAVEDFHNGPYLPTQETVRWHV